MDASILDREAVLRHDFCITFMVRRSIASVIDDDSEKTHE